MGFERWSWSEFPKTAPRIGNEVGLPANGWHALIAYHAGPGFVYEVPQQPQVVRVRSGGSPVRARLATSDEAEALRHELTAYLATMGVPAPPEDVEWRIVIPEQVTEDEFWSSLNRAVADAPTGGAAMVRTVSDRLKAELHRLLHD